MKRCFSPSLRVLAATTIVLAGITAGGRARADGGDKAAAEALFDQGKKLMGQKKYADACPKFAESLRLDAGIGTMLYLADCYEKSGKTASAWAQFREAAAIASKQGDPRGRVARDRAQKLEPKLAKLVVVVPSESDVAGLEVTRDESTMARALWGGEMPVDPGTHRISARAPKKRPWDTSVEASPKGGTLSVTVPKLADDPAALVVAPPAPKPEKEPEGPLPPPPPPSSGGGQRTVGVIVGVIGLAGLGVGSYFGVQALGKNSDSKANGHCLPDNRCDDVGKALRDDARSAATLSSIAIGAGAVALGAGIVLYATAPKAVKVGLAPGAVLLRGEF